MLVSPYENLSFAEKKQECFKSFIDDLQTIINEASPRVMVFIALDGSAPIAKQAQQRQRRFVSTRASNSDRSSEFSSVMITPGSEFMNELDRWLKFDGIPLLVVGKNCSVIFSPCLIPGEGEHKILDYIRQRSGVDEKFRMHNTHCMFGPDGDLIMLTMATPVEKIYLLRDGREIGTYDFLDVSSIRKDMKGVMFWNTFNTPPVQNRTTTDVANDFIFAGFFVGNDFLPKIQMFFFLEDGLEMMLRSIDALAISGKFITCGGRITPLIKNFISSMACVESKMISDQQYVQVPQTEDDRFVNWTLIGALKEGGRLDFEKYRSDFYKSKFEIDVSLCASKLVNVCEKYWRMLLWVFNYYTQGVKSAGWEELYPYHYAPLMTDLMRYLNTLPNEKLTPVFVEGSPSTPMTQLCSILPPQANYLVPEKYRSLLSGNLNFSIDYEGKTKEYQGVALIDFVDTAHVKERCKQLGEECVREKIRTYITK
jgi:5'-3' exonuclease